MTIEELFADYDARIKAAGVAAQPSDYFRAGYVFGGEQFDKANDDMLDAHRYRYLRAGGTFAIDDIEFLQGSDLDQAVDEARGIPLVAGS